MTAGRRVAAATVLASLALAGLTGAGTASSPDSVATASAKRCKDVNIGFTDASIRAKRVFCGKARAVFRGWRKKAEEECEQGVCPPIEVLGFTCRRDDTEFTIVVRCKRPVNKVVVAKWGD